MPCNCSSPNLISGSNILVGLNITHLSSDHYAPGICSDLYCSFGTSPIKGEPRFWTAVPDRVGKPPNRQQHRHRLWEVGYGRSDSCRSDDRGSHLRIWEDSLDQFFMWSACLATLSHIWGYITRCGLDSSQASQDSVLADTLSSARNPENWQSMELHGWDCVASTMQSQHNRSQLSTESYWWIPLTMLSSFHCRDRGLSTMSHEWSSLICLMPAARNN